jgi:hypothetical protein
MRTILALAAISVAALTFSLSPVAAQEAERATAISACTIAPVDADACTAAVAAFAAAIEDLPATEADALLADLVFELASAATPETQLAIAAGIRVAAAAMEDPNRAAAAIQVAALVEAGETLDSDTVDTLASPS